MSKKIYIAFSWTDEDGNPSCVRGVFDTYESAIKSVYGDKTMVEEHVIETSKHVHEWNDWQIAGSGNRPSYLIGGADVIITRFTRICKSCGDIQTRQLGR